MTMTNSIEELSTDDTAETITTTIGTTPMTETSITAMTETSIKEFSTDEIDNSFSLMTTTEETTTRTLSNIDTRTTTMIPPNLLENPGGELGTLAGWTQTGSSSVILDSGGVLNSGYNPHSGSYCFAGGRGPGTPSKLTQNVKLLGGVQGFTEIQLASRLLRAYVSFYYQTWDTFFMPHDDVEVSLTFRSSFSAVLSTVSSRALACKSSNPGWCTYTNAFPLPVGTRSIDYTMMFIRRGTIIGNNIDSYIDDNSLRVF
ncbi:unnamed protein product [Didymodactylos carnosus]|uniref:MAM domain-containing protein n=1 Tax=Didymodactylos carnosus TaxID=1234261 RepID=A0A815A7A1_9BILA|nr:unnamed protein product [Didymodactylos carnosus]CAF1300483.1 unnamed protein product [Didymodactylos carnosus]CAF4023154.1 unnamed protein product [Didymodactylos carnosus]CAF4106572.1 unnamed protein product [Didymodactylos carnosus]